MQCTLRWAAWLGALLLALAPAAADPVVEATRAERAPVIDGRLDDGCWAAARPAADFRVNNTDTPARFGTAVRVLFDDSALYVGVRCTENKPADIRTESLPRDNPNVFRTDCVEIMLDPGATRNDYFHFGVNASGSLADRACTQGGFVGDMAWDSTASAASFIGADFWSCEVAIPWSCLGITPKAATAWRINVCREKKLPAEDSSLGAQGAFNIAARFADLRGVNADLSRYCYSFGTVAPAKALREGKLDLSLQVPVTNATGKPGLRRLDAWLVSPTGRVLSTSSTIEPPAGKEGAFTAGPLTVEEQGDYTFYLRLADATTKKTLAYRKSVLPIHYVPVAVRLVEPAYRNAIFATQKLKQVLLDVDVSLDEAARKPLRLEVEVTPAAGGKAFARQSVRPVAEHNRVSFAAAPLPEDRLTITASLVDAAGKVVATAAHPLRKLPYRPGEVWLGADLQWRVDGKPFFLTGAWNYAEDFLPEYNAFTGEKPGPVRLLDTALMNELHHKAKSLREEHLSAEDRELCLVYVRKARENPNLLAYYVSDEPEVNGTSPRALEEVYRLLADEDPYHPVVISNDSMEGLRVYARCGDINGLHPYPVVLKDRPANDMAPVAAFVEGAVRFFATSPHKQTIAYLHQGFNYGDYGAVNNRIPNYPEYRNQNLLALICGARGTIQFNRMVAHYPELRLGMPSLTRELAFLEPVLLAPDPAAAPAANSEKVKMLLKQHDGALWLLACNADTNARDVTFSVPAMAQGARSLPVLSEGRNCAVAGDGWADHFEPWEVHVYATARDPGLPTVKQVCAEIDAANRARRKPGNLAFQEFEGDGVVVTASSSKAGKFRRPDNGLWHVVDGVVDTLDHYGCLTWQDDTDGQFPDWLDVRLPTVRRVGRVVVYPFEKSLKDYVVQVQVAGEWREVARAAGQSTDRAEYAFAPVETDRVRLFVTAANGKNAMVTEVEVYEQ